ncbi:unnamed protein product [Aureobasidium uvarum]|uniref:Uncharacterized protein n=1 Tax=Aureobasidium uvarum TaxID=2773716 RepID=A0A9N8KWD4_9PEZI|nr:unnamed protein product [Aureobasidium uvarum]
MTTPTQTSSPKTENPDNVNTCKPIFRNNADAAARGPWRSDPDGISHLGPDGVLRSLNADHTAVLDFRRCSPEELTELAAPLGQVTQDRLVGVDGRDVTDEAQLWAVPEKKWL